jgi:hypothetical protein
MINTTTIKESDTFRRHGTSGTLTVVIQTLDNCFIQDHIGMPMFYVVGVQSHENYEDKLDGAVAMFNSYEEAEEKFKDMCDTWRVAPYETYETEVEVQNV